MIKKTYQINTTRGVDLSSSPLNVAPSRASYMRNMINDGGVNKKRYGWNEIAVFEDAGGNALAINGIWEYVHPTNKTRWLVVYAGTKFFKCDFEFKMQEKITVEGSVNGQKCKAYYKDGLLWIIGCGDYLVYDGESISRVENSKYAYVPTTSIAIEDMESGGKTTSFDDVNLLNNRRINRLIGIRKSDNANSVFALDGKIKLNTQTKITILTTLGGEGVSGEYLAPYSAFKTAEVTINDVASIPKDIIDIFSSDGCTNDYSESGVSELSVFFKNPIKINKNTATEEASFSFEAQPYNFVPVITLYIEGMTNQVIDEKELTVVLNKFIDKRITGFSIKVEKGRLLGKVEIKSATIPITEEIEISYDFKLSNSVSTFYPTIIKTLDGITVEMEKGNKTLPITIKRGVEQSEIKLEYQAPSNIQAKDNITVEYYADYERDIDLTKSAVFTQPNGVDLLLVANRDNAIFYSGLDSADCEYSFGYISAEKFITFGSDREPITAIVPMVDSVGVFKGESFYRVLFSFNSDSTTYEAEYVPQITEAIDTNGCVNQFISCNVNGDTLVFDGAGVYGIEYSSNQRSLKLRSSNISKAFEKYSKEKLESAIACYHEGRYYLFIDGDVYIADSRFKVYESNRLDTSFEYEWWIWDNCSATVVCSINGNLYMGRDNGQIAVFDKEYKDRELLIVRSSKGEVNCTTDEGPSILTFNGDFGVEDGGEVQISCGRRLLYSGNVSQYNGKLTIPIESDLENFYIGKTVYVLSQDKSCEIIDFNCEYNCFVLDCDFQGDLRDSIYEDVSGKKFVLDKAIDGEGFLICEENSDGELNAITLARESYEGFFVIVECSKNVECEYHTPALDLGSNLSLKILNQLAITVSSDTEGQIEVGYQTNNNNAFMKRNIGGAFDFNDFDFNTFAFDGAFYKTHVKRVFERNFNYILFKLASRSDSAFGVENFSCVYSTNNKLLRGDR